MARVFLRAMYPYVTVGAPRTPSPPPRIAGADDWATFEGLIKACLAELGHTVREQTAHPSVADDPRDANLSVIAHRTRRDGAGDLFYKQMHLPRLFTIDSWGWGADHSASWDAPDLRSIDQAEADEIVGSLRRRYVETGISKQRQPPRGTTPALPDGYIFVPAQMPGDYVQIHHSPISVLDFVVRTLHWAEQRRQNIVVKLHPGLSTGLYPEVAEAVDRLVRQSNHAFCSNANVHDLIAGCSGVFTINSGVGFEALIHGKPVATFGNCDYKWVTYRGSVERLDEARDFVLGYSGVQRRETARFLWFYVRRHGMSVESEDLEESRVRLTEYLARATSASHQR
jgi:hypothetical protein